MTMLKVFTSERWDDDVHRLEGAVNEWLERERPVIMDMAQSSLGSHVLITFLFEHERGVDEGEERHAAATAVVPEVFERTLEDSELDPGDEREAPLPEAELPY